MTVGDEQVMRNVQPTGDSRRPGQTGRDESQVRYWFWQDNDAEELARVHNERFNVFVRPARRWLLPDLAWFSKQLTLRQLQQMDAVWYSLQRRHTGRGMKFIRKTPDRHCLW